MIRIDGFAIDVATDERLTYESEVTEFPVEKGAPVSDHIIAKRPVLELDCVVSDTPTGAVAEDPSRKGLDPSTNPSSDAFEFFRRLHGDRRAVVVECSFGKFDDMVMTSFPPVRNKESLKALKFTVTFKQIEFATNNRSTVSVSAIGGAGGAGKKKLGTLMGLLKDLQVTFVTSSKGDAKIRREKLRQGYRLVSTTTHEQRLASSKRLNQKRDSKFFGATIPDSPGFDVFAVFGSPGRVDHYFADQTETSDGYVTGHNKQDYFPYISHVTETSIRGRPVHWDYKTDSWVDDESNIITEKPPKGTDRWKNVTMARAPGPKP